MLILTNPSPLITAPSFKYTLLDQFTTDHAAPLGSPRAAEPTGSWTIVDTNSKFSTSGGRLVIPGGFVSGDRFVSASFARVSGRAFLWEHPTHATQSSVWREGWFTNGTSGTTPELGIQLSTNNQSVVLRNQGTSLDTVVIGSSEHCFAMVMRSAGGFYLTRNGTSGNYRLEWVHDAGTVSLFAKGASSGTNAMSLTGDNYRVTDLGGSWATDYGIATGRSTSPTSGTSVTHATEFLAECSFTWDGTQFEFWTNRADANNGWIWRISVDGSLEAIEKVSGSETVWAIPGSAGTFSSGSNYRLIVIRDSGGFFRVYNGTTKLWTGDGFSGTNTGTAAYVNGSGATDLTTWPRYIDLQGA